MSSIAGYMPTYTRQSIKVTFLTSRMHATGLVLLLCMHFAASATKGRSLWLMQIRHVTVQEESLQREQGEVKHLQCCAYVDDCQCLDNSNRPEEQHNLPAEEDQPNHVGYTCEWVNGVRPW